MDEWQVEMQEIRHRLSELRAAKGDADLIAELEAQLRILQSFYGTALDVFEAGQGDPEVRRGLAMAGMGAWRFENVYSYIYEIGMELELGTRELSSLIPEVDYLGRLRQAAGV